MSSPVARSVPRAIIEGRPALLVFAGTERAAALEPLMQRMRERQLPIIFAVSDPQALARGLATANPGEHWIAPPRLSAFLGTGLQLLLSELCVQTVLLAGGRTNVEVHYSFVDAHQNDFFCRVAADCMAGQSPALIEGALKAMEYLQTGARQTAGSLCDALRVVPQ